MIANPGLIGFSDAPLPALAAALKIGAALAAISFGIIAPGRPWMRVVLLAVGMSILLAPLD
jgi:hypothetical protein